MWHQTHQDAVSSEKLASNISHRIKTFVMVFSFFCTVAVCGDQDERAKMDSLNLTPEEQQLVDSLRSKYRRHGSNTIGGGQGPSGAETQAAASSDTGASGLPSNAPPSASASGGTAGVTLCTVCQGTGRVSESYHHRIIERSCSHCCSQGVLLASVPTGTAAVPAGAPPAPVRSSAARTARGHASGRDDTAAVDDVRSQQGLRRGVSMMNDQLIAYRKVNGLRTTGLKPGLESTRSGCMFAWLA